MATQKGLTTKEAAEVLGCSESWLRQTRMRGTRKLGPDYYKCGKAVRYTPEALEAHRDRTRRSTGEGADR